MMYLDPNLVQELMRIEFARRAAERQRRLAGSAEVVATESPSTRLSDVAPASEFWLRKALRDVIASLFL